MPLSDWTISVFALPDPEMNITHTGSPSSRAIFATENMMSRASVSHDFPSHFLNMA